MRNTGCGTTFAAMQVAENSTYGEITTVYQASHPEGFAAKRLNPDLTLTEEVVDVHTDFLRNVLHTGVNFLAARILGKWQAVSSGECYWSESMSLNGFSGSGTVELFEGGPLVEALTDTSIAANTLCDIMFDNQRQIFKITAQTCPSEPEYGNYA